MSLVRRTSPFGELLSLRQAMDRLFEDSVVRPRSLFAQMSEGFGIPLDVRTTPDAVVVEAALPGVKPEDVEITLTGDTLTISGSNAAEGEDTGDGGGLLYQEIRRGSFSRTITLPESLRGDKATANFEHGLLRLTIPKAEDAKPRQIRITTSQHASPDGAGESARPVAVGSSSNG